MAISDLVAAIPEDDKSSGASNQFTTSQGIVFKLKHVPPLLLDDAQKQLKEPRPPKVWIEDKQTHEENLADPDYREAVDDYLRKRGDLANAVCLTRGTEIVHVPEGIESPQDTDWMEDVRDLAGIDVPTSGRRRYYCWLKYVALAHVDDLSGLLMAVMDYSGLTSKEAVAKATEDLQRVSSRSADNGVQPSEEA